MYEASLECTIQRHISILRFLVGAGASMCGHANALQPSVSVGSQLIRMDDFINLESW